MNVSKKLFASVLCLSFLMNFQSVRARLSLGGIFLNGVGLCYDLIGFCIFVDSSKQFEAGRKLHADKERYELEYCSHSYGVSMHFLFGEISRIAGLISLGCGVGCHVLGSWLMWRKIEKNRSDAKLADECVCRDRYHDYAEATLQRLLKKQPD